MSSYSKREKSERRIDETKWNRSKESERGCGLFPKKIKCNMFFVCEWQAEHTCKLYFAGVFSSSSLVWIGMREWVRNWDVIRSQQGLLLFIIKNHYTLKFCRAPLPWVQEANGRIREKCSWRTVFHLNFLWLISN